MTFEAYCIGVSMAILGLWGRDKGGSSVPPLLKLPTSLCVLYHTYLSVAVVGGVDVVVVDEGAYNTMVCVLCIIKH